MTRFAVAGLAVLFAGCAAGHGGHAGGLSAACPARYALACDVTPDHRKVKPETCRCVRTSDVAATLGGYRHFGLRRRIRN